MSLIKEKSTRSARAAVVPTKREKEESEAIERLQSANGWSALDDPPSSSATTTRTSEPLMTMMRCEEMPRQLPRPGSPSLSFPSVPFPLLRPISNVRSHCSPRPRTLFFVTLFFLSPASFVLASARYHRVRPRSSPSRPQRRRQKRRRRFAVAIVARYFRSRVTRKKAKRWSEDKRISVA